VVRMALSRTRPPMVADERTQLVGWLDLQRALVRFKCEDLAEADAHRPVVPTSPLMTVAGVVSHLRWVEHCWFEVLFLNHPSAVNPQFGDVEAADFMVDDVPLVQLLDEHEQQCLISNQIVAPASLDDVGLNQDFGTQTATLRWMLLHVLEEVGRHVGQLDILRELLDGRKGYY
jgi:uncharacterized damage-inducible protein DinB